MMGVGMDLINQNILFFTRTMNLGGTENVILQLCEIFKPMVNKIVVCSSGGINVERLSKMGIKHYTISDFANLSPYTLLAVTRVVNSIVKKEKITIIHTHHRTAAFITQFVCEKNSFKHFHTVHYNFSDKVLFTKFAYKKVDIITVSEGLKEHLVKKYRIKRDKITTIFNSVDWNPSVEYKPLKEREGNDKWIGIIGRVVEGKGIDVFLKAIKPITNICKGVHFFIIGEGALGHELQKMVEELQITDFVSFTGYRNDIQEIIMQLDIIVMASEAEGLPMTAIEACASGTPFVGTKISSIMEVIQDGYNGLLFNVGDEKALAKCIISILTNEELKHSLQKKAQEVYECKFSYCQFKKEYIEFYAEH